MIKNKILQNPIAWYADFELYYMAEIDINSLTALLPATIRPIEIRPGIGIVGWGLTRFVDGNIVSKDKEFSELSFSAFVQGDLTLLGGEIPKNTCFPFNISSDSNEFLDYANGVDNMPVYRTKGFKLDIDYKSYHVSCYDNDGSIFELKLNFIPEPSYFSNKTFEDQIFTTKDKDIYCANVLWKGKIFETQDRDLIKHCKIYDHPFYKGIDVNNAIKSSYLLMLSPARNRHKIIFHEPFKIRTIK